MAIKVNFSDIQTFETLPTGNYSVIVESVELRDSKSSEYPYLNWTLEVQEGDYAGRKLWLITSLNPKALWKLQETLAALGYETDALKGELEFDPEEFVGCEAVASVILTQYQGREQNQVESLLPVGGRVGRMGTKRPAPSPGFRGKLR